MMQSDLPHTLYKNRKDNNDPAKVDLSDPAFELTRKANERIKARREADPNRVTTIEEIFDDGQH